ncbi:aspartate kinase [Adhaeribacter sp. BT258]|uniref:Aspartokinase n=1 Tax=Adhaeribacter terrigena TaxID=2793070 RepID=A0ABS1BY98_9BACT|nr:aspartate kinase [Adhaeribacter terrigena]MBK0402092.1 aspartate kinase [Adhaeribacter terrigena]
MQVFKFGGASVKDAAAFRNVSFIVQKHSVSGQLLIVVSAIGKTTNALETIFGLAHQQQNYSSDFFALKTYHFSVTQELFPEKGNPVYEALEHLFVELEEKLQNLVPDKFDQQYDQVISFGELLASTLLHHFLKAENLPAMWLDCRKYIQTDSTWREGKVDWTWTEKLIQRDLPEMLKNQIIVTQGFIGGTSDGQTTTLGREGSDYSAAIFAYCLKAQSMTIWKDVAGLLNADPKIFSNTVRYPQISYQETIEMAYYGASVIHPKTIKPLADRQIPLFVKSFLDPESEGTRIGNCPHEKLAPAFILKQNQCLISFGVKDFSFISEQNLSTIFHVLSELRIKINLMQNSAISFSICTDYHGARMEKLMETLRDQFVIQYNISLQLFTIKNYDSESIRNLTSGKEILLEQRTRNTYQFACRA